MSNSDNSNETFWGIFKHCVRERGKLEKALHKIQKCIDWENQLMVFAYFLNAIWSTPLKVAFGVCICGLKEGGITGSSALMCEEGWSSCSHRVRMY